MKSPITPITRICLVVISCVTSGFADADQDGPARAGTGRHGDGARPGREQADSRKHGKGTRDGTSLRDKFKSFKEADTNKDGSLSFQEFSQMTRLKTLEEAKRRRLFDYLDRDKDGQLHMRELQPRDHGWFEKMAKVFPRLDTNHNGTLDIAEFARFPEFKGKDRGMVKRYFDHLDRNKNGEIERIELKAVPAHRARPDFDFSKFDTNSNGSLDFQEYSNIPWMEKFPEERRKKLFERIDIDKNGEVSPKEIRSAHQTRHPAPPHGKPLNPHRGGRSDQDNGNPPVKPPGRTWRKGPEGGPDKRPSPPTGDRQQPAPVNA
ncbi:MAG: EF-hand domain-containing protein [Akkermansiaceae bacterium]|nr:EF-hand domain-containing protein [Akkermansiaceae bacterium]